MEFVLMDNSIVTAHTERVSRLANGVQNLKEKMINMFGHQQVEQNVNEQVGVAYNEPAYAESPVYNEPVYNAPVQNAPVQNEPVQNAPVYNAPVQNAPVQNAPVQNAPVYNAPVQNEPVMGSATQTFDSDMPDSSTNLDDDLDLDLDKMIADMRLDDVELGL